MGNSPELQHQSNILLQPKQTKKQHSNHKQQEKNHNFQELPKQIVSAQPILEENKIENIEALSFSQLQQSKQPKFVRKSQINQKLPTKIRLSPIKNKSMTKIEEMQEHKQNCQSNLKQPSSKEWMLPLIKNSRIDKESVEVSDLRDSQNNNLNPIKQIRIKKMRVSKNSLALPGAYF